MMAIPGTAVPASRERVGQRENRGNGTAQRDFGVDGRVLIPKAGTASGEHHAGLVSGDLLVLSPDPDEIHDVINTTSSAFLGLTVACARCHNHKFDPILQKDYYAFQAVFAGVRHGDRPVPTFSNENNKQQVVEITLACSTRINNLDN